MSKECFCQTIRHIYILKFIKKILLKSQQKQNTQELDLSSYVKEIGK